MKYIGIILVILFMIIIFESTISRSHEVIHPAKQEIKRVYEWKLLSL
ncbi:MAG: hypothetical protein ACI9RG_001053 [Sulfurimonas sp.]|jgi:hypothetical protein